MTGRYHCYLVLANGRVLLINKLTLTLTQFPNFCNVGTLRRWTFEMTGRYHCDSVV